MLGLLKQKTLQAWEWVKARWEERSTWDGAMIAVVCGSIIVFGDLVWWAAWVGLAYGVWDIIQSEGGNDGETEG